MEEFDEEEGDVIHHQHRLLSCLDLATEGQYSILHKDKSIYSDPEKDFMPRAWPDVTLPRPPLAQEEFPEAIKKQLVADMLLQHSTAVKVLERIGVNTCKEYQRTSAVAVLARVRKGNKVCSICGHTFSSTQSLRSHIQGQHLEAAHLKCKVCAYSAGDSYSLRLHMRSHNTEGKKFPCTFPGCNRSYHTRGHLNEHLKTHTEARPVCPNCNKDFAMKYGLKSHLLSCPAVPGGKPDKTYVCETCDKKYYRQSELTRHQKNTGH